MAQISTPIKIGNYWTNLVDSTTGESVNFEEVTEWVDGTPMDDSKVDGVIYRKLPTSVGGGYVKRVISDERLNVKWFGVLGDGVTDDTIAIQKAFDISGTLFQNSGIYYSVLFPMSAEYLISDTLFCPTGVTPDIRGYIRYSGPSDRPAMEVGYYSDTLPSPLVHQGGTFRFNIVANNESPLWEDDEYIGVRLHNIKGANIYIEDVSYFNINVVCMGHGSGFQQNNVFLSSMKRGKAGIKLTTRAIPGVTNPGFCNENNFYGGDFWSQNSSFNVGKDRYGVWITTDDGGYPSNNNNRFYKPCFQIGGLGMDEEFRKIPVFVEHGYLNRFDNCRVETPTTEYLVQANESHSNVFDCGWSYSTNIIPKSVADGVYVGGTLINQRYTNLYPTLETIYHTGDITRRVNIYNASGTIYAQDELFFLLGEDKIKIATDTATPGDTIKLESNHLEIGSGRALCVKLDTSFEKKFFVSRGVLGTIPGRIIVKCFDSDGNDLGNSNPTTVKGTPLSPVTTTNAFGGTFQINQTSPTGTPEENLKNIAFEVADNVSYVYVGIAGYFTGTPVALQWFSIGSEKGAAGVFNDMQPKRGAFATAMPTTGTYSAGDRIYAITGLNSRGPLGWVCAVGGTPGTWHPFGEIGYNEQSVVGLDDIDFNKGNYRYKTYTTDATMTFSNSSDGKRLYLRLINASTLNTINITLTGAWVTRTGGNIVQIPPSGEVLCDIVQINGLIHVITTQGDVPEATTSEKGIVNQMSPVANIAVADAVVADDCIPLANANKAKIDQILIAMRVAGLLET